MLKLLFSHTKAEGMNMLSADVIQICFYFYVIHRFIGSDPSINVHGGFDSIIKRSCGKVMFSQASVHRGHMRTNPLFSNSPAV